MTVCDDPLVILPLTPLELGTANDAEILAAYASVGVDKGAARAYLAILRGEQSEFVID